MNVSMDLNNILNQVQNNLNVGRTSLTTGNDVFLAMLNSVMNENNPDPFFVPMGSVGTGENNDLMMLLAGNDTDYLNLADMSNTDINKMLDKAGLPISDTSDKQDVDNSIAGSYLMQNYYNLIVPQLAGLNENTGSGEKTDILSDSSKVQDINKIMNQNNFYNNENSDFSDMKSSGGVKQIYNEKIVLSPQAEKLISEIEAKRNRLKSDISSNAEMLNFNSNKNIAPESNKIIQLTDESAQIRPQIVEQVRDNIIMLTEIETADGSAAKQVTMELYPRELGKVDIKMIMVDNKMTVEIKALNEETHKILASGADELLKSLSKTAQSISIVFKSDNPGQDYVINNYDKENVNNLYNQEEQNLDQDNKKRNEYYHDEDSKSSDDETFSELINSRIINR